MDKTKISVVTTSIQHCVEGHANVRKGRSKTISIFRWHNIVYRKFQGRSSQQIYRTINCICQGYRMQEQCTKIVVSLYTSNEQSKNKKKKTFHS